MPLFFVLSFFLFLVIAYFLVGQFFHMVAMLRGAPFVPTKDKGLEQQMVFAQVQPGQRAADLGSGDGRVVIALAQAGAEAHGYEINPLLVLRSRFRIRQAGLAGKAFIHWQSFWNVDFTQYSVITAYILPPFLEKLEKKLEQELHLGARFVSYRFPLPHWQPKKSENEVYLYEKA